MKSLNGNKISILAATIFAILACSNYGAFAQESIKVNETRSKNIQLRGSDILSVTKTASNELVLLTQKMSRYGFDGAGRPTFLSRFNAELKIIKEKKLPQVFMQKRPEYRELIKIGQKYLLFFTFDNEKAGYSYLFYVQIDPDGLSWFGTPLKVAEIPLIKRKSRNQLYTPGYYKIALSENGFYILITGVHPAKANRKKVNKILTSVSNFNTSSQHYTFWLLNEKNQIVNYYEDLELNTSMDKNLELHNVKCDVQGNIFVVTKSIHKIEKLSNGMARNDLNKIDQIAYTINMLNTKGQEFIYTTPEDLLLTDINIGFSPDGKTLDAVGLIYESINDQAVATKIYTIRLSKENLAEVFAEETAFNQDMLLRMNQYEISRAEKKLDRKKSLVGKQKAQESLDYYKHGVPSLNNVVDVVYNDSGYVGVLLEKYWLEIVTVTNTDSRGNHTTTTYYIYHYGDLVMISNLGNAASAPAMDFIDKDFYSQIKYKNGVKTITKDGFWYILAQNSLFKINSSNLTSSKYTINTRGNGTGAGIRGATTRYSNSIFTETFTVGNSEFLGVQVKGRKKFVLVKLKPS